jgi:hypothetical protein
MRQPKFRCFSYTSLLGWLHQDVGKIFCGPSGRFRSMKFSAEHPMQLLQYVVCFSGMWSEDRNRPLVLQLDCTMLPRNANTVEGIYPKDGAHSYAHAVPRSYAALASGG